MAEGKDEKTSEETSSDDSVEKQEKSSAELRAERRAAAAKKDGGKAAAKPGAKKGAKRASDVPELEDPDALMTATLRAMEWANKHRKHIVYGIALACAAGGVVFAVSYYRAHREEAASELVAKAVNAELAPTRTGDEDPEIAKRVKFYANEDEKQKEAIAAFQEAEKQYGDTGPGLLAKLGEAGVHLDRREWDEAIGGFEAVKSSALAAADKQVRMRCLEGLGYAREGKGLLDDARHAFEELANLDVKGAKALGLYHQARIDLQKGDKAAATSKLKAAHDAINQPGAAASRYLKDQIEKLLAPLDPTAVPPKPQPGAGGIPGMPPGTGPGGKYTKEQLEEFIKAMQQQQGGAGGMPQLPPGVPPGGGAPPPPPGAGAPPPGGAAPPAPPGGK